MKPSIILRTFLLLLVALLWSCSEDNVAPPSDGDESTDTREGGDYLSFAADGGGGGGQGSGNQGTPGVITAGEWNDLQEWDFWEDLFQNQDFSGFPDHWSYYTGNRISCEVSTTFKGPVVNETVELIHDNTVIWTAKTDNQGKAELWLGLNDKGNVIDLASCSLRIGNSQIVTNIKEYADGVNEITFNQSNSDQSGQIAFVVDATGSMADELEFLKDDLQSVIQNVIDQNRNISYSTAAVFYRDQGDEYVVKHSGFTDNLQNTISFIDQQHADGGGDFPEAVHTALRTALNDLSWSDMARARMTFLLLDAPPHHEPQIISELHGLINQFSAKGIKLIPIVASGIDKETEFLMRFFAITTNGTYVFITDDSGVGNDHLEPSVGEFDVELLNELLPRLITQFSE